MRLTRQQRKLCLLNVRLRELERDGRISRSSNAFWCGRDSLSERVLNDWLKLSAKGVDSANTFVKACFPETAGMDKPVTSDEVGVFSFGAAIGMDDARIRYVIDHSFASRFATYNSFAQERRAADEFIGRYGGLYNLYRYERGSALTPRVDHPVVVKCAVSIRYPVPYREGDSRRHAHERIRCKISVPRYDGPGDPYKYDGYVAPTRGDTDVWHWLLELREADTAKSSQDILMMYTERLKPGGASSAPNGHGAMFTQNQGQGLSPTLYDTFLVKDDRYAVVESDASADEGKALGARFSRYFYLRDIRADKQTNERAFMREQLGVIVNDCELRTPRGGVETPSDVDRKAADIVKRGHWSRLDIESSTGQRNR